MVTLKSYQTKQGLLHLTRRHENDYKNIQSVDMHFYLSLLKFQINKDWNPNNGCYTVDYNLCIPLLLLVITEQTFKWFRCNAFQMRTCSLLYSI